MVSEPLAFVGIDWAGIEQQACLNGTGEPVQRTFAHEIGAIID